MGPRVGLEGVAQGSLGPSGDPEAQEGDGDNTGLCLTELSGRVRREGAQRRPSCSPPTRPHGGHGLPVTATVDRRSQQLSQVAGCSHPSWECSQTAASDKIQTSGPGQ